MKPSRAALACLPLALLLAAYAAAVPRRPGSPAQAALLGAPSLAPLSDEPFPDPFSIQRVFLPPERRDAANQEVARGALKKLPKVEFEALVQNAARTQLAALNPSRILEATYRATVQSGRMQGSAEWQLASRPGAMPLDPLPGAIQSLKWSDGRKPLIYRIIPDGKNLPATYLWIESAAQDRFAFDWSARIVEQPDDERCTLTFPPSPISVLELTLSADRVPFAEQSGILLTGPFPAPKGEERIWKVAFGGQTRIDLAFRKSQPAEDSQAAIRAGRAVSWKLGRSEFAAQFDFTLQSLRVGSRQLTFLVDPGLEIDSVTGGEVEAWEWVPVGPRLLRVRFRAGAQTTHVKVQAREMASPIAANWIPPQIRLANASLRADSIEVQVPPDFKLDGWLHGDYRLGTTNTSPDRSLKLEFVPALLIDERAERRPPTIRLRPAELDFSTVESLDWRLEPNRSKLSATYSLKVLRGPISTFAFQASAGYQLESVTLSPDDPGATFGALPGVANGWTVEPSRAVATGKSLEIRLEFRETVPAAGAVLPNADGAKLLPLPKVAPIGSSERKGIFTVRPIGGMKISMAGFSAAQTPLVGEPGFSVAYRGREPDGDLLVSLAVPAISAKVETGLTAHAGALRVASTLSAHIEGTPLESFLVWVPSVDVRWQIEPSATAVRIPGDPLFPWLPGLGSTSPWTTLALTSRINRPRGSLWRIALARPMLGELSCSADWEWPRPRASDAPLDIPIPHYFGVPVTESIAKPDSALLQKYRVIGSGQPEITLVPKDSTEATLPPAMEAWEFRDVQLQNRIESGDRILCTLRGTVVRSGANRLPISIECDRLESVLLDGRWLAISKEDLAKAGLPISKTGMVFEVQYSRRLAPGWLGMTQHAEVPVPALPGDPPIRSQWSMVPEFRTWPELDSGKLDLDTGSVFVVKESNLRTVSWITAILICAGAAFGGRRHWGFPAALIVALILGSATLISSDGWDSALRPPLAAAFVCPVILHFVRRREIPLPKAAVWGLAAFAFSGAGQAQAPEPAIVFVVPGSAEHPERHTVLAPKAVIEKLVTLGHSPLPDAVILSADYDCLAFGDTATVKAKYAIHTMRAEEQLLSLPLAGVRLEKAMLDGQPAFPDAAKPDRFLIPIRGVGDHELILQFVVSVATAGIDREVKFTAPDLPVSHVNFAAGLRARQVDVASRSGGQTIGLSTAGLRAEAEQGGGRTIHLRWREGGAADGAKPTIIAKEAAVWDLGESESLLTAVWQCRVEGGTVSGVKLELPEGAFPSSVSIEATEGAIPGLGIRSWKVGVPSGGMIPVDVRLQNPVEGRFTLIVKGYSSKLPAARPVLTFPRIAGLADLDRDSFHAVRHVGMRSEGVAVAGAIDFPAEAVTRDFGKVPEFNFGKSPPARVVQRAPGKATELRPALLPTLAYQPVGGEVIYTLGRRIEVEGAMRIGASEAGIVEFDVPTGLILRDVWSPDLAGWTRTGSRIQARWSKPVAEATVRWSGQLPNPPAPDGTCDLPLPRWPSAAAKLAEPVAVRVRAAPGWSITPLPVVGLKTKAAGGPDEWLVTVEPEKNPTAKFTANAIAKPETRPERPAPQPPSVTPPQPPVEAGAPAEPVGTGSRSHLRPLRLAIWLAVGALLCMLLLRAGHRWRPEAFALLGVSAVAVLGVGSLWALPFWCLTGCAILIRALRSTRRILRIAFG